MVTSLGRKLTTALLTPSSWLTARCTLWVQLPHVMPVTSKVRVCMSGFF